MKIKLLCGCVLCLMGMVVSAAVPTVIENAVKEMVQAGVEMRAGHDKTLGVYLVAMGEAEITGSKAKAKNTARTLAYQRIAEFMGAAVSSSTQSVVEESTVNGKTEVKEFFKSVTETQVKQLLKGVLDYGSEEDGDTLKYILYLTTRAQDASDDLKNVVDRMGDSGTVKAVGEGRTHDVAVQLAIRSAVEQVLGTMVVGESKVCDNVAVRSKVFAGAQGFVDEYRIVEETTISIGKRVEIVAKVSKKKILDSYDVIMKVLGDPAFYLVTTAENEALATRFGQFFKELGFKVSLTPEGARWTINTTARYRNVVSPINEDESFTQLSVDIKIYSVDGKELVLSIPNNPKKSAQANIGNPDRIREKCVEKAFKQMRQPVHEGVHKAVAKWMADHTAELMNSDE